MKETWSAALMVWTPTGKTLLGWQHQGRKNRKCKTPEAVSPVVLTYIEQKQLNLLGGEDRWTHKTPEGIFDHVLHQVGSKHFLIVDQERRLKARNIYLFVCFSYNKTNLSCVW